MDGGGSPNVELLEEVFSEVAVAEGCKESNTSKAGFLEDLINFEKELLSGQGNASGKKKVLEEIKSSENVQEDNSTIHEGLTDSSDDEDNKYFEESKYNECGRRIKHLIKQTKNSKFDFLEKSNPKENTLKSELEVKELKKKLEKFGNSSNEKELLLDPILGMRIINPLVSSASLKEKLKGRTSISTLKVRKFLDTPAFKDCDWVTGGAIVSKFTRTSKNGNQYCVWHITDLMGDIKTVCVFLFGSAYKEFWKTSIGAVVAILNPIVMDNKEKSEATLRVDNAQKILLMGTSGDYGLCKSKKKNGDNCSSIVNKSKCEYCIYHMKKEYNRACKRSDLQPPKIGRSLDNLRAKVLGKNQVFYGGKTFSGVIGKKEAKPTKKDEQRLNFLSQKVPGPVNETREKRDKSTLSNLSKSSEPIIISKETSAPSITQPKFIDLGFTITKKERNAAKANALKYIREHGPLKKFSEKTKKTPEQISSIKRKLEAEAEAAKESKRAKTSNDGQKSSLSEKYLKNGITDEFLKLMRSESRDAELLKIAESNEREKYFDKFETREKIEEKMASTFKVECKAVRCLKCNYKSFSASDLCKKERHPLKVVNAFKRFWKCGKCFGRTVCLELFPLHPCKTCGSSKWERASMMREKKDSNLVIEKLSLRGDEEKFVGAAIKQAKLNLLVPEQAS